MSKSSDLGWSACRGWQPCNCLRMPEAIRFQESRMSGNLLVRFDEGRVGRIAKMSPSLLLYRDNWFSSRFLRERLRETEIPPHRFSTRSVDYAVALLRQAVLWRTGKYEPLRMERLILRRYR